MNAKVFLLFLCIFAMGGHLVAADANAKLKKDTVVRVDETEHALKKATQEKIEKTKRKIEDLKSSYKHARNIIWMNRAYMIGWGGVATPILRLLAMTKTQDATNLLTMAAVGSFSLYKIVEKLAWGADCLTLVYPDSYSVIPEQIRKHEKEIECIEIEQGLRAPKFKLYAGNL